MKVRMNKEEYKRFKNEREFIERVVNILDEDPDYYTKADLIEIIWGLSEVYEWFDPGEKGVR